MTTRKNYIVVVACAAVLVAQGWYFHDQSQQLCHAQQQGRQQGNVRAKAFDNVQVAFSWLGGAANQARQQTADVTILGHDGRLRPVSEEYRQAVALANAVKAQPLPEIHC